jgi:hypothetical protein
MPASPDPVGAVATALWRTLRPQTWRGFLAWGIAGFWLLGRFAQLIGGPRSVQNDNEGRYEAMQALAKADSADGVKVRAFLANPDTTNLASVIGADEWAYRTSSELRTTPAFAAVHRAAVRAHLDSAAKLLAPEDVGDDTREQATLQVEAARAPLVPADSVRQVRLRRRLAALMERRVAERAAAAAMEARDRRTSYAARLESEYLDKGMDVTVTTRGKDATTLHLKWILVSRPMAHQLSKSGVLETLRGLGFTRFIITDGYDESWSWTL